MFIFLKEINPKLSSILRDIDNKIINRSDTLMSSFQMFYECLFKYINKKEKIILKKEIALGDMIRNTNFRNMLAIKFNMNGKILNSINELGNYDKHSENINVINVEKVREEYKNLFYYSLSVYNYYIDKSKNIYYDDSVFDGLLNVDDCNTVESKLREENDSLKKKLDGLKKDKEILEKRIIESDNSEELAIKQRELSELEIKYNELENKISKLSDEKNNLEKQKNEEKNAEKNKYTREIRRLNKEKQKLVLEIDDLRDNYILNPNARNDYFVKLLEEKNLEIQQLEELIKQNSLYEDEKLLTSYKKNSLSVLFTSSYVDNDDGFILKNVGSLDHSKSEYSSFYAVLFNLLQRGKTVNKSKYLSSLNLSDDNYSEIYKLEMMILSLLKNGRLRDRYWRLNYVNGDIKLLKYAVMDILMWIKLLVSLTDLVFVTPRIVCHNTSIDDTFINISYNDNDSDNVYLICDYFDDGDVYNPWISEEIQYNVNTSKKDIMLDLLDNIFGFDKFNPGQFEIICHALNGNNTIGILPTGGGKSLIYQLTSLLQPKISLVVAPLNSLIKDQIYGLGKKYGITRCLNLTGDNENLNVDLGLFNQGQAMFVFVSPERLQNCGFRKILYKLSENNSITRVVLDEVHCLSEWGHDFRVPYLMLAHTLRSNCKYIKYLGLTATASTNVIKDLKIELGISYKDFKFVTNLRRNNLKYHIKELTNQEEFKNELKNIISDVNPQLRGDRTNSIIVFVRTKAGKSISSIENTRLQLSDLYDREMDVFSGDYKSSQDGFINNEKSVLIATKAFGMGIDKPNVRATIHYGIPSSLENFYQEAGRAGRDFKDANCYLLTYDCSDEYRDDIEEFFNPQTSITRLKDISSRLRNRLDLSTNFFFISKDLKSPYEETIETIELFNKIIDNKKGNNESEYRENTNNEYEEFSKEKYLYLLHKIGIVDNWEKYYNPNYYKIVLNDNYDDMELVKQYAKKYIDQYGNGEDYSKKIDNLNEYSKDCLIQLIYLVRSWYYDNFIQAKRNQLATIYEMVQTYANKNASQEIQNNIEKYFDLSRTIDNSDEGYDLTFSNNTFEEVIEFINDVDLSLIEEYKFDMIRTLESVTNKNINLYTSLLYLKGNDFDNRNGAQRFRMLLSTCNEIEINEIYSLIAKNLYSNLDDNQKEIILKELYFDNSESFRNVFLENIVMDKIALRYTIPYYNRMLDKFF